MRVVVAPGSYKGTITAYAAAQAIAEVVDAAFPNAQIDRLPMADGGEGTLEVFSHYFGARLETHAVRDPLGRLVPAQIGFFGAHSAVIESSQAIGLSLLAQGERDPYLASSYGVGELIGHAIQGGARRIFVTMGDSATMDMGIGALSALGVRFDPAVEPCADGLRRLSQIAEFDDLALSWIRDHVEVICLVDTNDYLCGDLGQAALYGVQKGLREEDVSRVDSMYIEFSALMNRRLGVNVAGVLGAAGSGGLAASLHAFLNGRILSTLDFLSDELRWADLIGSADVTITGEGRLDNQTKQGKAPNFVARLSRKRCFAIVGGYTPEGLSDLRQVCPRVTVLPLNPVIAVDDARSALRDAAAIVSAFLGGMEPV